MQGEVNDGKLVLQKSAFIIPEPLAPYVPHLKAASTFRSHWGCDYMVPWLVAGILISGSAVLQGGLFRPHLLTQRPFRGLLRGQGMPPGRGNGKWGCCYVRWGTHGSSSVSGRSRAVIAQALWNELGSPVALPPGRRTESEG